MKRRDFVKDTLAGALGILAGHGVGSAQASSAQVAITIDDFNIFDTPVLSGSARNRAITDALERSGIHAAVFVAGKFVDDEAHKFGLLERWDDGGHVIGNHSYSHWDYAKTEFPEFARDFERNQKLLEGFGGFRPWFRFPFLREGNTAEHRDEMRAFLRESGYRNAHVTIDASDWYVDGRLRTRQEREPDADLTPYRDFYLEHIWERASYYDELARSVLGRSVPHTLLLHHNVLNGLFLGDLLAMFQSKGWELIDIEQAYTDPVFSATPDVVPAGQSIVWSLAKETGDFDDVLRYPGEDGEYERAKMDALGL